MTIPPRSRCAPPSSRLYLAAAPGNSLQSRPSTAPLDERGGTATSIRSAVAGNKGRKHPEMLPAGLAAQGSTASGGSDQPCAPSETPNGVRLVRLQHDPQCRAGMQTALPPTSVGESGDAAPRLLARSSSGGNPWVSRRARGVDPTLVPGHGKKLPASIRSTSGNLPIVCVSWPSSSRAGRPALGTLRDALHHASLARRAFLGPAGANFGGANG